jgi:hypothetical protein
MGTSMRTQIPAKLKTTFILLSISLIAQLFALFFFTLVDNIVHHDLYSYGLQFDNAWARLYWDNADLFMASIAVAMVVTAISIASIIRYIRKNNASLTLAGYILPYIAVSLNIFSVLIFARLNTIINSDLYNYGLQYVSTWGIPLLTYSIFVYFQIGIAIVISIATPLLLKFGPQAQIMTEEPEISGTSRRTAGSQLVRLTAFALTTAGTAALLTSIFYNSSIFAFIGLGLIFWGILSLYLRTEEYTKKTLLSTVAYPEIATLNQILYTLSFRGSPIYLPPKYFTNPKIQKAYIPKQTQTTIPTPQRIKLQESHLFIDNASAMLLEPPGSELTRLFEKTLGKDFTKVNLQYLEKSLPKLIINVLEIAQNFEIETGNNQVRVKIENSVYSRPNSEEEPHYSAFGSALDSAIALALARTTGNPIIIENQQTSKDGKNATIEYHILTEGLKEKP